MLIQSIQQAFLSLRTGERSGKIVMWTMLTLALLSGLFGMMALVATRELLLVPATVSLLIASLYAGIISRECARAFEKMPEVERHLKRMIRLRRSLVFLMVVVIILSIAISYLTGWFTLKTDIISGPLTTLLIMLLIMHYPIRSLVALQDVTIVTGPVARTQAWDYYRNADQGALDYMNSVRLIGQRFPQRQVTR